MHRRSSWIAFLSVLAALPVVGAGSASAAKPHARAAAVASAPRAVGRLTYRGTVNLKALAAAARSSTSSAGPRRQSTPQSRKSGTRAGASTRANPNPSPKPLAFPSTPPSGFVGLTAADNGQANGFDLEPPDQGLCAHGNTVMEAVNLVLDVYTEAGQRQVEPVSLNQFFGLSPAIGGNGSNTTYGPFLSDPRCYYDAPTGRWFVAALEIDVNPYTGNLANGSSELIAVSSTSDPTGSYGLFSLPSSNDGTDGQPNLANCPCLGDQPRIGADKNGLYISDH